MRGNDTITRGTVEGSGGTCLAIRTTTLSYKILLLDVSALDRRRCSIFAGLVKMGSGSEFRGSTFRSAGNILLLYRSIKEVIRGISSAKFLTIQNQSFTCKLAIRT